MPPDVRKRCALPSNFMIGRFTRAIDVIDRVPRLQAKGAHAKEKFRNEQISCRQYAHEHGVR